MAQAATRSATDPGALFSGATALLQAGDAVAAAEALLACIRLAPGFGAAHVNLAEALRRLGLLPQAQAMAETGVTLLPDRPEASLCLAGVLHEQGDYTHAADQYRRALAAWPDHPGALGSLGNTLFAMGDLAGGIALQDRAVALAPHDRALRISRAACLLASGDFARGWDDHAHRPCQPTGPGAPWHGEPLGGRRILLLAEQGLGDTLQFARYGPLVAARGGRVLMRAPRRLVRLLRSLPGVEAVVASDEAAPDAALFCPLLSLPRLFGTRLDSIPAAIPYLAAEPAEVARWAASLPPAHGRMRIGLVWAGAPHPEDVGAFLMNRRRSLDPSLLAPLADIPGVQWISLQMPGQPAAARRPELDLHDPMAEVTDFAATAAIVAHLDLVLSVDTAVAHLAGALGCPVWLLSRHDGCWRWLLGRDDSPWYPTMRLYRQERPLDWTGVLSRVRRDLMHTATTPRPRAAPAADVVADYRDENC